jgi:hypothetical protein
MAEAWTVFGSTRGRRGCGRRRRSRLGAMRRRGRRLRGVGATAKDERVVLLRKEQGGGRQRIHKSWGKGLGGRRLTGGRRIQAELAAAMADPDEKLRRPGGAIDLEKGGG